MEVSSLLLQAIQVQLPVLLRFFIQLLFLQPLLPYAFPTILSKDFQY